MAEDLERHRAVERGPRAHEDPQQPDVPLRDHLHVDREQRLAQRLGHHRVEVGEVGVVEVGLVPHLDQQLVEVEPGGPRGDHLGAAVAVGLGHRVGEDQRELRGVAERPAPEGDRGADQLRQRVVGGLRRRPPPGTRRWRPCRSRRRPGRPAPGSSRRSGRAPGRSSPSAPPPPAATGRCPRGAARGRTPTISSYVASRCRSRRVWACAVVWVTRGPPASGGLLLTRAVYTVYGLHRKLS